MKKFLFVLLLMLFVSSTSYAQIYKNSQYGFQVEYPSGWMDATKDFPSEQFTLIKIKMYERRECISIVSFSANIIEGMTSSFSMNSFSEEELVGYITRTENTILKKYPDSIIIYSDKEIRYNIPYVIIEYKNLQSKENRFIALIKNKTFYMMRFSSDRFPHLFVDDWDKIFDSFLLSL